jgi:hypothetical protein
MPTARCPRCSKEFKNYRSLGQHQRAYRESRAKGRANRICPDRRDDEEAREIALLRVRLMAKLGLMGRHA